MSEQMNEDVSGRGREWGRCVSGMNWDRPQEGACVRACVR